MKSKPIVLCALFLLSPLSAQGESPILRTAKELATTRFLNFTHGTGEKKVDCTAFVLATVLAVAKTDGVELSKEHQRQLTIANLTKEEGAKLDALVEAEHRKIRGVQTALIDAGLGKEIAPKDAQPGDLVQYWYKTKNGWRGHAAIVERLEGKEATLYGSHLTTLQRERKLPPSVRKGGVGSGPVFDLSDEKRKVYVVRYTGAPKGVPPVKQ